MINHIITKDKTMFDLFNMIQPNCYQAYIIQCIIEDRKQDAISYCNELQTAVNYYKWNVQNNTTDYTDCLNEILQQLTEDKKYNFNYDKDELVSVRDEKTMTWHLIFYPRANTDTLNKLLN